MTFIVAQGQASPGGLGEVGVALLVAVVALALYTARDAFLRRRDARGQGLALMRLIASELQGNHATMRVSIGVLPLAGRWLDEGRARFFRQTRTYQRCTRDGRDALTGDVPLRLRLVAHDLNAVAMAYMWAGRHNELIDVLEQLRHAELLDGQVDSTHYEKVRGELERCAAMTQELLEYLGVSTLTFEHEEEDLDAEQLAIAKGDPDWWKIPRWRRGHWARQRSDRFPPPVRVGDMAHRRNHEVA